MQSCDETTQKRQMRAVFYSEAPMVDLIIYNVHINGARLNPNQSNPGGSDIFCVAEKTHTKKQSRRKKKKLENPPTSLASYLWERSGSLVKHNVDGRRAVDKAVTLCWHCATRKPCEKSHASSMATHTQHNEWQSSIRPPRHPPAPILEIKTTNDPNREPCDPLHHRRRPPSVCQMDER